MTIPVTSVQEEKISGRLAGKVALVTGAARAGGIGRAIALALAQEGADIAINDFRREEEADEIARMVRDTGRRAAVILADVMHVLECRRLVAETVKCLGRLDILVNNASGPDRKTFEEISEAQFDQQLGLHLKGPCYIAQAAILHFKAQGNGRIINMPDGDA